MAKATIELQVRLGEGLADQLHQEAQARGVTESAVIEQALELLFRLGDAPMLADYWFSIAAMREDWEAMPEDWAADQHEAGDAVPTR